MSSILNTLVTVNVTTQAAGITREGFGVPLILGYHTRFPERFRTYTNVSGMTADGFVDANTTTGVIADPQLTMARAFFAQSPKVTKVNVGRLAEQPSYDEDLTIPTIASSPAGVVYSVTINGNTATFTTVGAETQDAIATALDAQIQLLPGYGAGAQFDSAVALNVITITAGTAAASGMVEIEVADRSLTTRINNTADTTPGGVAADLAAVQAVTNDYYTIHPTNASKVAVAALDSVVEAQEKLMLVTTGDDEVVADTAGNIAETVNDATLNRTKVTYSPRPHAYLGAAWAGQELPLDPGAGTWEYDQLTGQSATVTPRLTSTELGNLSANKAGVYVTVAGRNTMIDSRVAGTRTFLDVVHFVDFFTQRLREDLFIAVSTASGKVPYTQPGFALIENAINGVVQLGISNGGIAADPAPVIVLPALSSVTTTDKEARILRNVEVTATLAGAIHTVIMDVTLAF